MNKQNENEYKKSINSYKFIPSNIYSSRCCFFYILYHYEVQTKKNKLKLMGILITVAQM